VRVKATRFVDQEGLNWSAERLLEGERGLPEASYGHGQLGWLVPGQIINRNLFGRDDHNLSIVSKAECIAQQSGASVDFPAPFGPAMMMTFGFASLMLLRHLVEGVTAK